MLPQRIIRLLVYFMVASSLSSANADPTQEKAEAKLAGKINCEDFRKNPDGTWTSGPNAKIGSNPFSNLTFESKRVTIGGADLATVLDRKCGHCRLAASGCKKLPTRLNLVSFGCNSQS